MSTKIYLIRHGRTDWNALRILQGRIERDLDEEGRRQAHEAGERFADKSFKAIYSSKMGRALQTAEIIAQKHKLSVCPIDDLHEVSYGPYEGMSIAEYEKKFAKKLEERRQLPKNEQVFYRVAEEVETHQEVVRRVLPRINELGSLHLGETILIVSHGAVIRSLLLHLHQERNLGFPRIRNGGHIVLQYDKGSLTVLEYEEAFVS